ncbi:MAG: hypothetical protein HZR80_16505 [Candidatus Heimdallarchaeota archaeon]
MNEENNKNKNQELINNFLAEVERKLPFWLKDQKEDIEEILEELETHIWDKATVLAEELDPSEQHIRQAINQMGSPSKIASEYKRRGKPKFYITEELFPLYTRVMIITAAVSIGINLLIFVFSFASSKTVGDIFGSFFSGVFTSFAIVIILVSAIFIFLSYEGYLPEDLGRFAQRFPKINVLPIIRLDKTKDETTTYAEPLTAETEVPISNVTTYTSVPSKKISVVEPRVVKETIIVKEPRVIQEIQPRKRVKRVSYVSGRNYLSEGITGMVFGTVFVVLPFLPILDFIQEPFRIWITIFGAIMLLGGVIKFLQAMVGRLLRLQQLLMFLGLIPTAANIPLFLTIIGKAQIFTTTNVLDAVLDLLDLIIRKIGYTMDTGTAILALTITVYILVGLLSISLLTELIRIVKLEVQGFPEKEITYYD